MLHPCIFAVISHLLASGDILHMKLNPLWMRGGIYQQDTGGTGEREDGTWGGWEEVASISKCGE